jgi:O-methyltransferase involved in polyketide biosynthesis
MKDDRPSLTAVLVAYNVLALGGDDYGRSRLPPNIIETQVAVLLAANLPFGTCPWLICNPLVAKVARFIAAIWYPGFFEGIGFRKLIMECQVRDYLQQQQQSKNSNTGKKVQQPTAQVVVVAAGYDTLALRLCREYPHVNFWEVDHPATSHVKSRVWTTKSQEEHYYPQRKKDKLGMTLGNQPANMQHVQADLTKLHLDEVLKAQPNYDSSLPTIVIVEGLSMYLTEAQICQLLFVDIESSISPGGMVVFDFFGWNAHKKQVDVGSWIFPTLHKYGITGGAEPWKWGLDPKNIHHFLATTNWKLMDSVQSCGFENVAALELQQRCTTTVEEM